MTGYELRLWRSGQYSSRSIRSGHWRQEDAAEQLGVAFRTYCYYEKNGPSHVVILGTQTLSLQIMLPELEKLSLPHVMTRLNLLVGDPDIVPAKFSKSDIQMPSTGLKSWRKSLGWTQKQVSETLGVCLRTYKSYEQNTPRTVMLAIQAITLLVILPRLAQCRREVLFQKLRAIVAADSF